MSLTWYPVNFSLPGGGADVAMADAKAAFGRCLVRYPDEATAFQQHDETLWFSRISNRPRFFGPASAFVASTHLFWLPYRLVTVNEEETPDDAAPPTEPPQEHVPKAPTLGIPSENPDAQPEPPVEGEAPVAKTSELDTLKVEYAELKNKLLRTAADYENFRKRALRELDEARTRTKDSVIRDVLPLVDNLERAVQAANTANDVTSVVDGVKMVLASFSDIAENLGIKRVEAVGKSFDPNCHDAMQQLETTDHPPGTVVAEILPGYTAGDRLIRAAMVAVAKAPSNVPPAEDSDTEETEEA